MKVILSREDIEKAILEYVNRRYISDPPFDKAEIRDWAWQAEVSHDDAAQ